MTQKEHDELARFIKEYWSLGVLIVFVVSFAFGAGVRLTAMQGEIDMHDAQIKQSVIWQQQTTVMLGTMAVQLAQNSQALQDIKSNLGITQQRGGN